MTLSPWETRDGPLDVEAMFGRRAPVVLEIGYGNGDFLVRMAREQPERDFLGVEIAWASTTRALSRVRRSGLTNVRLLQGDAVFLLRRVLPADALDAVVINFSDPWPKPRHHGRRLIQPGFLETLFQAMQPGAPLTIATDHAEYADWIAETLEAQNRFENTRASTRVDAIPGRSPTRYEAKALRAGVPIHYFLWRKPAEAPSSPPTPIDKVADMPNMTYRGSIDAEALSLPEPPVRAERRGGETVHIKYTALYRNAERGTWLVETLVQEEAFSQHVALLLAPRPDDHWVLKPSSLGQPRPTWGVKCAVGRLGAWLLETQPGLELQGNTTGLEMPSETEAS